MTYSKEQFNFTFQTEDEQFAAERTGYIESYDCVRMEIRYPDQLGTVDFPVKNRQDYERLLLTDGCIIKVYPTVHSYDVQDYL